MRPLFTQETLEALRTPGVAERWQAVQERLHPALAQLAEAIAEAAAKRHPRFWPLYQLSFKHQRYIDRGRRGRAPIEDYWVALDRPPRGAGVLLAVSAAERAVLVGLQLWGARKGDLARVWGEARPVWAPLVERIGREGQARFSGAEAEPPPGEPASGWLDRYLASRRAGYLWAGFVYPWEIPLVYSH